MSEFKVTSPVVAQKEAEAFAAELERVIGEIANGKRKPQNIPMEPMIALIQFARDAEDAAAKAARWDAIETLMIAGDVELTQTEDGGYSIYVEPVENIVPKSWEGDTPDQAADMVVAQLMTPNV